MNSRYRVPLDTVSDGSYVATFNDGAGEKMTGQMHVGARILCFNLRGKPCSSLHADQRENGTYDIPRCSNVDTSESGSQLTGKF